MPVEQLQALILALAEPDDPHDEESQADLTRAEVLPADLGAFEEPGDATDEFDLEPTVYLIRSRVSTCDRLIAALAKP